MYILSLKSCNNESLVLEYMERGELKWRDENENPILSERETKVLMRDVICGLEYRKESPCTLTLSSYTLLDSTLSGYNTSRH